MSARDDVLALRGRMAESILGQEQMIERLLLGLLANGNLLVEGLPGLAKTRAIKSLARHLDAQLSAAMSAAWRPCPVARPGAGTDEAAHEPTGVGVSPGEFTNLRVPHVYNLRADPFERGPDSLEYGRWMGEQAFVVVPAQAGRGTVAGELQGVPDPPEAGQFQPRRGDAQDVAEQ